MAWFRHQLPVYSPLTLRGLTAATGTLLLPWADPRAELATVLEHAYEADSVLLCGSGTEALQLAIGSALEATEGDRVIGLPAFGCFDLATAAVGAGVRVALYDVDPTTLSPDLDSLGLVIRSGVRAVVVANLYGIPVDWQSIRDIADAHGTILIEDAAQGHGATWRGRRLGSLGPLSVVSFGRGKGWTGGGGGALLFRGSSTADGARLAASGATGEATAVLGTLVQTLLGRPAIYGLPKALPLGLGQTRYREPRIPRNIARASAAIALAMRAASDREAGVRWSRAAAYSGRIAESSIARPIRVPDGGEPGFLRFPVLVNRSAELDWPTAIRMGAERSYPKTLAALDSVRVRLAGPERSWPGADRLVAELITLPTHSRLNQAERDRLLRILTARPAAANASVAAASVGRGTGFADSPGAHDAGTPPGGRSGPPR